MDYLLQYPAPYFLVFDYIPGVKKGQNNLYFDIGKKLAQYPLEKIFLINRFRRKEIIQGLLD
ncbi:MAG: hypothetical protein GXP45_06770 [bacterium]|nr:hypothetical protein [bacterium]